MNEEIIAYQKYLFDFGMVEKPKMPKFDELAYTDNEYQQVINSMNNDFDLIDDEYLTIQHLKGD
jgi:hypothetical protein